MASTAQEPALRVPRDGLNRQGRGSLRKSCDAGTGEERDGLASLQPERSQKLLKNEPRRKKLKPKTPQKKKSQTKTTPKKTKTTPNPTTNPNTNQTSEAKCRGKEKIGKTKERGSSKRRRKPGRIAWGEVLPTSYEEEPYYAAAE